MFGSLLLILLAVGLPVQDGGAVRQSEADFARGVALQQQGDLQHAKEAYEAALRSVPNRADALSNLGVIYSRLGQYDEAIKHYKEALAVDENQHDTRLNLGIAFYKIEEFDLAQREIAQVLKVQPENNQARLLLGVCYYQLNKLPDAVAQLEAVHSSQPDNVAASYALANAYLGLNDIAKAEPLVSNVFRQLNSAESHLIVGSFYLAVKDFPKALEELNQAKELNALLPTLHSQLAEANLFSGNREQAAKEFEAELKNNPRDFNANVRLGWIYREDGRLDEAAPLLKKALELRPNDISSLYQMAQLAAAKGDTAAAVSLLERVTTRTPEFSPAHVLLARLYYKLGRTADGQRERDIIQKLQEEQQKKQPGVTPPAGAAALAKPATVIGDHQKRGDELQRQNDLQGAVAAYRAQLSLTPRRVETLGSMGAALARLGQYGEAVANYKEALAIDPKQDGIRTNLGIAYYKSGAFEQAQKELSVVAVNQPANYWARLMLGLAFFQLDRPADAVTALEPVVQAQPTNTTATYTLTMAYIGLRQLDKAEALINKTFRRQNTVEAHLVMGEFHLANGEARKAIDELKLASQINPRLPTVHSQLGNAYLATGSRDLAAREFTTELETNTLDYDANVGLGMIYREDGKTEEAANLLKTALLVRPNEVSALYQMALLRSSKGEIDEAVRLLEQIVKQAPDFSNAHVQLARLYYKLNRTADAQRESAEIKRLDDERQKEARDLADTEQKQRKEPAKVPNPTPIPNAPSPGSIARP